MSEISYSEVENRELDAINLTENPEKYLIFDLSSKFICIKCEKILSWHKSPKSITLRCGCGCRILYPANPDGLKLSTYISSEEYKKKATQ